jgi:tRNA(Ile)-lysidine synthase TilS/MesJ
MKIDRLRKKYPKFFYQGFGWEYKRPNLKIWFDFLIASIGPARGSDLKFKTKIIIKKIPQNRFQKINKTDLENLIFHLGLIEMLNYWKLVCSPEIIIEAGNLERVGKLFLRKIILNGMGQYFYENKIDFTKKGFLKIKTNLKKPLYKASKEKLNPKKILIPIGGGKDSPVTIELLRKKGNILGGFILNPKLPQIKIAKIAKLKETIIVERKLDPLLSKLNKSKKFLNGHVPFSAFLAFLSLILAYLFDYQKIAFSWEKSSDEPNLKYKGRWINHQWSKSSQFEKVFNEFTKKYLLKNVEVFSSIRHFSEIEIAQIFSKFPKYHFSFLSCNKAYRQKESKLKWCGKCPKCLFVFASLFPFLPEKKLVEIFGKNLFEDKSLLPLMEQLIGKKNFRPFECVGTKKDSLLAFSLSLKKVKKKKKLPLLLQYFSQL